MCYEQSTDSLREMRKWKGVPVWHRKGINPVIQTTSKTGSFRHRRQWQARREALGVQVWMGLWFMLFLPATIYYPKMVATTNLLILRSFLTLPSRLVQFYKISTAKGLSYRIDLMDDMDTQARGTFDALDEVKTGMKRRIRCILSDLSPGIEDVTRTTIFSSHDKTDTPKRWKIDVVRENIGYQR